MAMQIAAIAVGTGGAAMALAAEASAAPASPTVASPAATEAEGGDPTERMHVNGWSCWGAPVSRGPLAPPEETEDFARLLEEVPA